MTLSRFVFKTHKWLAVVTAVFTFLWFASSIVMVIPRSLLGRGAGGGAAEPGDWGAARAAGPNFKAVVTSVPQAVAAVEAAAPDAVARQVELVTLENLLYYRIGTARQGAWFVNALDGRAMQIDAAVARRLVMAGGPQDENLAPTETLTRHTSDYPGGRLPVYRVTTRNGAATFIVEPDTGAIRRSTSLSRWRAFIVGWHTLDFMKPWIGTNAVIWLMWIMSLIGTAMTLFGFWILWIQFVQWRAARGRA